MSRMKLVLVVVLITLTAFLIPNTSKTVVTADREHPSRDLTLQRLRERQVGAVPELALTSTYLSPLPASEALNLVISFEHHDEAGLRRLIDELYDPASPRYHQWITPEEFGERFGRSQAEFEQAAQWLSAQGFTVDQAWPNRLAISFTGTTEVVERAFQVKLGQFQDYRENRIFFANQQRPTLPPELDAMTVSLKGLSTAYMAHTFSRNKGPVLETQPAAGSDNPHIKPNVKVPGSGIQIGPKDLTVAYNISSGSQGLGQRVGIIISSDVSDSDMNMFRTAFNLPALNLKRMVPPGLRNPGTKFEGEAELDVSCVSAVAPRAEIDLVVIPSLSTSSIVTAEQFVINTAKIPVVNESFGGCEQFLFDSSEQTLFLQAVAQGIGFFASSGDEGAECAPGTPGRASINSPACYDGVTSVGATMIDGQYDGNGDLTTIRQESVWNEPPGVRFNCDGGDLPGGGGGSSGGGVSTQVAKPDYQIIASGFSGGVPDGSFRFIPDISLIGGPPGLPTPLQGRFFAFEGTSASSPFWAGLMGLINQAKGSVQGSPNRELYRMGVGQFKNGGTAVYRDITVGNNSTGPRSPCAPNGVKGTNAVAGYDSVTGWGVPNFDNLVKTYGTSSGGNPPAVTTVVPKGGESIAAGDTTTISWVSKGTVEIALHSLDLSVDSGTTFSVPIVAGLSGTAQSYSWKVPFTVPGATTARVRVSAIDRGFNTGVGVSAADFTIKSLAIPTSLKATVADKTVQLAWTAPPASPSLTGYAIYRSTTSPVQVSFDTLAARIRATTPAYTDSPDVADGQTTYFYVVTAVYDLVNQSGPSNEVSAKPGGATGGDQTPPVVKVVSPNGGETVNAGGPLNITWTSSDNVGVAGQTIDLSTDSGATFGTSVAAGLAGSAQTFTFNIPATLSSTRSRVRVMAKDAAGNIGLDSSDADFTIKSTTPPDTTPPTVQVLTPNGGEKLKAGATFKITWQSSDAVGVVSQEVFLSTDGGAGFPTRLATGLAGSAQSFDFAFPTTQGKSKTGRVRVTAKDAAGNEGKDDSDANFQIKPKK